MPSYEEVLELASRTPEEQKILAEEVAALEEELEAIKKTEKDYGAELERLQTSKAQIPQRIIDDWARGADKGEFNKLYGKARLEAILTRKGVKPLSTPDTRQLTENIEILVADKHFLENRHHELDAEILAKKKRLNTVKEEHKVQIMKASQAWDAEVMAQRQKIHLLAIDARKVIRQKTRPYLGRYDHLGLNERMKRGGANEYTSHLVHDNLPEKVLQNVSDKDGHMAGVIMGDDSNHNRPPDVDYVARRGDDRLRSGSFASYSQRPASER